MQPQAREYIDGYGHGARTFWAIYKSAGGEVGIVSRRATATLGYMSRALITVELTSKEMAWAQGRVAGLIGEFPLEES